MEQRKRTQDIDAVSGQRPPPAVLPDEHIAAERVAADEQSEQEHPVHPKVYSRAELERGLPPSPDPDDPASPD